MNNRPKYLLRKFEIILIIISRCNYFSCFRYFYSFKLKQRSFHFPASLISSQCPIRLNCSMTGNDNRKGITGQSISNSSCPPLLTPICFPILPYVLTHPLGMLFSARRTRCWKLEHVLKANRLRSNFTKKLRGQILS